jgi:hypothetical protein
MPHHVAAGRRDVEFLVGVGVALKGRLDAFGVREGKEWTDCVWCRRMTRRRTRGRRALGHFI